MATLMALHRQQSHQWTACHSLNYWRLACNFYLFRPHYKLRVERASRFRRIIIFFFGDVRCFSLALQQEWQARASEQRKKKPNVKFVLFYLFSKWTDHTSCGRMSRSSLKLPFHVKCRVSCLLLLLLFYHCCCCRRRHGTIRLRCPV